MTSQPTTAAAERLLEEACDWVGKMHSGHFGVDARQQLADWRATDASHEQAWQNALALWQGMEALRGRGIPGAEPLLRERYRKPADRGLQGYSRRAFLAAACCAALTISLAAYYPPRLWQADYLTNKGERRQLSLADGSRVTLNSGSAVEVHFDGAVRRIELLQGEAFFQVTKDANHPFIVSTDGREIRAVGTAFDVHRLAGHTDVELVEGIVELQDAEHKHRLRLQAGQAATIGAGGIDTQPARPTENMALWRDGLLQFDGLPLGAAVAQINRYRPGKLILLNQALAETRISGLFRLDALDQAVASLKTAVPQLQILAITPYLLVLR
jgi:transmembrane sensor